MSTTDYDAFKLIGENRKVTKQHMRTLAESIIKTKGNIQPIVVNKKMEVVDGQHRLEACRLAGIAVNYIVIDLPLSKNEMMIELNKNSKNWSTKDYLSNGVDTGIKGYARIADYMKDKNNIGIVSLVTLCGTSERSIREGMPISIPKRMRIMVDAVAQFKSKYREITGAEMKARTIAEAVLEIEETLGVRKDKGLDDFDLWNYEEAIGRLVRALDDTGIADKKKNVKDVMVEAFNWKKAAINQVKM